MRSSGLLLFSCAGLLFSGGSILGITVAWSLLRMSYYFWISDLGVELGSSILFIAGALLCLPAGWLSTLVPNHTKSVGMNATLLGLLSVSMLLLSLGLTSMSSLSRVVRHPASLNASMLRAMTIDGFDPVVRGSFATMQIELRCCGVQSYSDWYQHRRLLPPSCCGRNWNGQRDDLCYVPLFSMGCLRPALTELRYFANTLSTLASALIIVMAVTLFAASYMMVTNEMKRVHSTPFKPTSPLRITCLTHSAPPHPRVALVEPAMPPVGNVI